MVDKIVDNEGIKVQYRIRPGKGKTLIFLHGGGGSLSGWDLVMPYFQNRQENIITVDLRGHGLSDRPDWIEDYTLEKHAGDIYEILKREKIGKAIIVGHCLGSMVGVTLAMKYPENIDKLILINTGDGVPWFIDFPLILFLIKIISLIIDKIIPAKKGIKRVDYTKFCGTSDLSPRRLWADLRVMGVTSAARQALAFFGWRGGDYFSKLNCPILVIAGINDSLYPKKVTEKLVKDLKNYALCYIDANHIAPINNPRMVYSEIIEFL